MAIGRLSKIGLENIKWWDGGDRAYSVKNYLGGVDVLNAIGDMVDVFAVTGARDQNAISKALTRIGSTNVCLYLGYGNWSITSDLTIPSNVYIYLTAGSMFNINTGVTLTLPSPNSIIAANNQQIFDGAGTVAFSYKEGIVWPGWKGAIGDGGTTNCTTALYWALGTHCEVRLPEASSYYKITGPILDSTFSGDGTLIGIGKPEIRLVLAAADDDDLESCILADASTTNLTVKNVILRGNADGAHGYGIGIAAAQIGGELIIDNVELSYWSKYGLYMWDLYADIGFVEAHHNGVQGIAITNNTKQINAGLLYSHDNGTTVGATVYGNGLDIEWSKSRAYGLRNINIETVVSTDNAKRGVQIAISATPAEITAQGLTKDDFGNIKIGTVVATDNGTGGTYSGVYIEFHQVTIDNILSSGNTKSGLIISNGSDNDFKGLNFGVVETFGNTNAGIYMTGSSTYPWHHIRFDSINSHDNGTYGLFTPSTYGDLGLLDIGTMRFSGNTTADMVRQLGLGRTLLRYNTDGSTSGGGEDTFGPTHTIAANDLSTSLGVHVIAAGTKTGANGNKTLKFYFGSASVTFHAAANNENDWRFEADIYNTGTTNNQKMTWVGYDGVTLLQGYEAMTEDTTAEVIIKMTGQCADVNDVITRTMWDIKLQ